ncbi:MAG: BrnT family toxin [Patescibacteria group bacterium]|jgi:hypothetical protein
MLVLPEPIEFQWDSGNNTKNEERHCVLQQECEEVFFDLDKKILKDVLHSEHEDRYILLGHTKNHRPLFIVFTIRQQKIRIISARDLNKKELTLL